MIQRPLHMQDIVDQKGGNLASLLDYEDRQIIAQTVRRAYDADKQSRAQWEVDYAKTQRVVQQLIEEKSFPWQGASNVKFPLITIAAVQYHARAYPALFHTSRPVEVKVTGLDPQMQKMQRADRVSRHMSYQITEEDTGFEEGFDKALLVQAVNGCAFKKTYWSAQENHVISELVMPNDLVINYYAKSLETAPRITHCVQMSPEDLISRQRDKSYLDEDEIAGNDFPDNNTLVKRSLNTDEIRQTQNETSGLTEPSLDQDTPIELLEQHCLLDLDGDGYREPYIATIRSTDNALLQIVARYGEESIKTKKQGANRFNSLILNIKADHYFTKMPFIPSPDGSIYDMGFGKLLGASSATVDTLINQLVDAGTMATTNGGFISRNIRIRGGDMRFSPLEWKRVDSTGEDLVKGIYPLPVREPSKVLYELLNLMIDFAGRIGMATDPMTGASPESGQKTGTTAMTIEQGEKVFNGIYKRTYRALREEFRKIYRINFLRKPLSGKFVYGSGEQAGDFALWTDYLDSDRSVSPAADPNISSREKAIARDMQALQLLSGTAGANINELKRRILVQLDVAAVDQLLPKQPVPPPPPPQVQVAQLRSQDAMRKLQVQMQEQQARLAMQAHESEARIKNLEAQTAKAFADAQATGNQEVMSLINSSIQQQLADVNKFKAEHDVIGQYLKHITELGGKQNASLEGIPPMESAQEHDLAGAQQGEEDE